MEHFAFLLQRNPTDVFAHTSYENAEAKLKEAEGIVVEEIASAAPTQPQAAKPAVPEAEMKDAYLSNFENLKI